MAETEASQTRIDDLHKQSSDLDLKLAETAAKNKSDNLVLAQKEQERRRLQSQLDRAKQAE